jgi:hypothetical protein
MPQAFTPAERALIRSEFMDRWGEVQSLREGIWLRRWVAGPNAGRPKIKSVVQSMLDRGLVEIVDPQRGVPTARFTPAGIEALRAMAANRKQLPPDQYEHLIEELQQL